MAPLPAKITQSAEVLTWVKARRPLVKLRAKLPNPFGLGGGPVAARLARIGLDGSGL